MPKSVHPAKAQWVLIIANPPIQFHGYYNYADAILHPPIQNIPATIPIWMDEVQCAGNETRLVDCPFPGFDAVNCVGNRVVEVTCRKNDPDPSPVQGNIRLVDTLQGIGEIRGRVEVFIDGFWVRICDDSFDIFDAGVACRQLGYSSIGKL